MEADGLNMKVIKTAAFQTLSTLIENIEAETLAEAVASEMEEIDSRTIARERAVANLTKDYDYYKKKKEKEKTGSEE